MKAAKKQSGTVNRTLYRDKPIILLKSVEEQVVRTLFEMATPLGWQVMNVKLAGGRFPSEPKPTGAILSCDPELAQHLQQVGCPVVRVDLWHGQFSSLPNPHFAMDVVASGRLAAEHFAERGFKHVAYVGYDPWGPAKMLYDAFAERAAQLRQECHLLRFDDPPAEGISNREKEFDRRTRLFREWMDSLPKPIGLLGCTDGWAAMLSHMCIIAGIAIPEEVAVLGHENFPDVREVSPVPQSSINRDCEFMCRQAVDLLRRLMDGEPEPSGTVFIPPKGVMTRRSTDILAVSDPLVATAVRFMWDHLDSPALQVNDIAAAVGVSRSKLERAFKGSLGRGINVELRRKRLETACELLRNTKLSVAQIAFDVGIGSAEYLHRAFRKQFSMTPRQYRLRRTT